MGVAVHLRSPLQEMPEIVALPPHELPELQEADLGHLDPAIGFDPPQKIGAAPRGQTVASGGVPEEAEDVAHRYLVHDNCEGLDYAILPSRVAAKCRMLEFRLLMPHENDRGKAEGHYYAALDLFSEGKQEQALLEYERSVAADPTFTEALHGMARALQDLNRLDEAISVANRIAELDPEDVLAHTSLSVLYQKKGMIPEAEAEGNKARILGWKQELKNRR